MSLRRLLGSVGLVVAALGVAFVVRELVTSWPEVRDALSGASAPLVAASFVVASLSMMVIGLGWRWWLAVLGARVPVRRALSWYYVGQLGKYVPGGIWPIVGRGEMARRGGVHPRLGYSSTVLSLGVTYLAAILVVAATLVAGASGGDEVAWQPVVALLPIGVLGLHPAVVRRVLDVARRLSRRPLDVPVPRWRTSVLLLLAHVPAWVGIGLSTWLVALALDPERPDVLNLVFAGVLSWVVGFLFIPAPGGIGVREAVFVAAATSLSSLGIAAAVAVVTRVLFVLVDVLSAGVASLVARGAGPPAADDAEVDATA